MNKENLIKYVKTNTNLNEADVRKCIDTVFAGIVHGLKTSGTARFIGFGTFKVMTKLACTGRNPRTGEPIVIAETRKISFKSGKAVRGIINVRC